MNTTIALLFSKQEDPSNPEVDYKDSYKLFAQRAKEQNIGVHFCFLDSNYQNNQFLSYWIFEGDELLYINKPFTPDIVYVRNRIKNLSIQKRVNSAYLEEICRDKYKTALLFPEYTKKTVLLSQTLSNINELQTDLVVLKPRFGANGRNVKVMKKESVAEKDLVGDEYIAQELIDSSDGINGLLERRHELRTYVFNGIVRAAYIRVPAADSYLANISCGATEMQIDLIQVPKSALTLVEYVDNTFKDIKPRLYTLDIMYENDTPWIIELNDNPGMPDVAVQPFTDNYMHTLLDFLCNS